MKSSSQLDRLRIASPCPTTWEQMKGDQRVRFCELCSLHVYNIAELTAREAKSLIANTEGRICARIYRRSDGTVITKDCPVGLRAIRRRVARIGGAVFATVLSLCGSAFSQKIDDEKSCKQQVQITRTITDNLGENGAVTGTVLDPMGAVVPGAGITLIDAKKKILETSSDAAGHFEFAAVAPGTYELAVKSAGFKYLAMENLRVAAKETVKFEAVLLLDGATTTVGILVLPVHAFDTSKPGTMTISGDTLRKLPIP
jgi:Carboxypeptidase regulatory-like domain